MKASGYLLALLLLILALAAAGLWGFLHSDSRNALRHIVLEQCVPGERQRRNPAPCSEVNLTAGYSVMKDRRGPLQQLLMPNWRINGIESPLLLDPQTPNYFWHAWQARRWLSQQQGTPLPDSAIALAINSRSGRTQNHLHIHISCLRPAVRAALDNQAARIGTRWQPLPGGLRGHTYLARRITQDEFSRRSPLLLLAEEVAQAREHMGRYALALVQQRDGSFIALATERNLLMLNRASAEEVQDHNCTILSAGAIN